MEAARGIDIGKNNLVPRFGIAHRIDDAGVLRVGCGITVDPFNRARPLRTNYPIMAKDGPWLPDSWSHSTTLRQCLEVINGPSLGDAVLDMPAGTVVLTMDTDNITPGITSSRGTSPSNVVSDPGPPLPFTSRYAP